MLQGLLFSAFVNGAGLYEKFSGCNYPGAWIAITVGLLVIAFLGITFSITAARVIEAATRQIIAVRKWWGDPPPEGFPPVSGAWKYAVFSTSRMPYIIALGSALLVLALLQAIVRRMLL